MHALVVKPLLLPLLAFLLILFRDCCENAHTRSLRADKTRKFSEKLSHNNTTTTPNMNTPLRSRQKEGTRSTYLTNRQHFRDNPFVYDPSDEANDRAKEFFDKQKKAETTKANRLIVVRVFQDWILQAYETPASPTLFHSLVVR